VNLICTLRRVRMLYWFEVPEGSVAQPVASTPLCIIVCKTGKTIFAAYNRRRFNELRFSFFGLSDPHFAPISGIDKYLTSVYLCPRRRLKGLAKINRGQSKVSWVISSLG
jgi:hypothetical protein